MKLNECQRLALRFDITGICDPKKERVRLAFIERLKGKTLSSVGLDIGVSGGRVRGLLAFSIRVAMTKPRISESLSSEMQRNGFEWDLKDIKKSGLSGVGYKLKMLEILRGIS